MRRFSSFAWVLAAQLLVGAGAARATSFHATLNSIKINGQPGTFVNRTFELTLDPNDRRTQFKARAEDGGPGEDGSQSFHKPAGSHPRSCASWVSINPAEATVEPGQTLKIQISVAIPAELEPTGPGGYWAAFTVDQV